MELSQISALLEPISPNDPCGPDLDLAGDADFLNALAGAESLLPGQFFQQDGEGLRPFAAGSRDFEPRVKELLEQLNRSRDIRLIVILAKYAILDRKLAEFVDAVELVAELTKTRWDEVNPKGEAGNFALRVAALQALDDRPHVVLPLQNTPLIRHPRSGVVTWRSKTLTDGAEPAEGESFLDPADLKQAFATVDIAQVLDRRDCFARLVAALEAIRTCAAKRLGEAEAADLPLVLGLSRDILAFLDAIVVQREPSATPPPPGEAADAALAGDAAPAAGEALADAAAAAASLAGVAAYFERFEPSSPALLLVRGAERLVGKTFSEVIQILLPGHADAATIEIGGRQTFAVPVLRLAEGAEAASEGAAAPSPPADVADRQTALSELRKVERFYMEHEPTSPVPFFCERARKLTAQDFLTLLKEVLPEDALKTIDGA